MPPYWDPRLLLDVYPLEAKFKCTATTAKGHRCGQTFIDRKVESDRILETLSRKDVVIQGLDDRSKLGLRTLAELTQCPRWHRYGHHSQTEAVYLKWFRTISDFITEQRTRIRVLRDQIQRPIPSPEHAQAVYTVPVRYQGPNRQAERAREAPVTPAENDRRPRQPRDVRAPQPPAPAPAPDLAYIQRLLNELNRRLIQAEEARARESHGPAPLPAHQAPVRPQPPAREVAPVVEDINPPPRRERPLRLEIIADRAANEEAARAASLPTPPQSPIAQERASPHRHAHQNRDQAVVDRKPLTGECYICYEPFEGPDAADTAVWCRRRCGQNLHAECFEEWSRNKVRWEVKCGYCRANWVWE